MIFNYLILVDRDTSDKRIEVDGREEPVKYFGLRYKRTHSVQCKRRGKDLQDLERLLIFIPSTILE